MSEKILKRIEQVLRRTTGNGATQAEAEAALKYAEDLMAKHNIEMAEVEGYSDSLTTDDVVTLASREVLSPDQFEKILAQACAKLFECDTYMEIRRKQTRKFVGLSTDAQVASSTFLELLIISRALARAHYGKGWTTKHKNFCRGFALGIWRLVGKLIAERAESHKAEANSSTALMVVKSQLIKSTMANLNVEQVSQTIKKNGEGFKQGVVEGENYSLAKNPCTKIG